MYQLTKRAILLLTAVALAAAAESVTGGVAFVGLRVPHFARASGRTSKSALPAGSDSDPRLAAYHRKKHTGTQRHTCEDYDRFNRGSLFYVFVDEE